MILIIYIELLQVMLKFFINLYENDGFLAYSSIFFHEMLLFIKKIKANYRFSSSSLLVKNDFFGQ